jgi:putative methyltransferase (TIGR04325 family)
LRRSQWHYVGDAWPTGDPRTSGWSHPSVVAAQLARWPKFLAAVESTAPLAVNHESAEVRTDSASAHNAILSFCYVLARAAGNRGHLSVLDWGGGLGYYAAIARAALPDLAMAYTVKEMPAVCAEARRLHADVTFIDDETAALSGRYDLVFASNSIQYAEDWRTLIGRLGGAAGRWLFLTRVPNVRHADSFVVSQRPHHVGYRTEYLSWVFNRDELLAHVAALGLRLQREFLMVDERNDHIIGAPEASDSAGFLFRAAD